MYRSVALLALIACAPDERAPDAARHWVEAPGPVAWPLGSVTGRIGRAQAPQPVLREGIEGASPGPLRMPTAWPVPGTNRAVVYGLDTGRPAIDLIDVDKGVQLWRVPDAAPVVGVTDDAIVCSDAHGTRALGLDGKPRWNHDATFIAMTDDRVIEAGGGEAVISEAASGDELARVKLPAGVTSDSIIASCGDAGRELFAAGQDGTLGHIVEGQGGPKLAWSTAVGTVVGIDACEGDSVSSSLSEMVAELVPDLGKDDKDDLLDNQVATALLTGIVSATERFGNAKTTSDTMQVAAKLLTAGANQELVATKLNEPQEEPKAEEVPEAPADEPADSHAEEDSEHADADALLPSPLADAGTEDANNSSAETATENPEGDTTDKPADEDTAKPAEPEPEPPKTTPGTLEIEHSADEAPAEEAGGDIALMPEPIHDGHGEAEDSKTDSDTSAAAETDKPAAESSEEPSGEPAATDAPEMPGLIAAMPQPATDTSSEEPAAEELAGNEPTEPDHETQAVAATGEAGPNTELGDKPADAMLSHHTVIQPIHDEPLAGDVPPQPDLDATKFALTPPSLGGTLTANDDSDKPLAPAGGSHPQILKHDALGQPPAAPSFDAQAAEAEPAVAPLPAPTAVTDAAPSEAGQPGQPSLAPEPLPSLIASPLLDGSAPAAPPAPEADAPAIPDPAQAPLDPSLATGQPIAPATPASAPADPVMKPADMPLPSPTLIPSIQSMPAPAPVGAAAPPTTPPPLQ